MTDMTIDGIDAADFLFVAEDCEPDPDGRHTMTEIFGYFDSALRPDGINVAGTASLVVPVGSPIAMMAHQVDDGRGGGLTRRVAATLLGKLRHCQCADAICAALDETAVVEAIEKALADGWP